MEYGTNGQTITRGVPFKQPKDELTTRKNLQGNTYITYNITIMMPQKYKLEQGMQEETKEEITNRIVTRVASTTHEELITPWQFLKRMILIAYASLRYPFYHGDVIVDFETGEISKD